MRCPALLGACMVSLITVLVGKGIPTASAALGLAPIRYWGDVGYEYRWEGLEGGSDLVQNLATANLNANTFIWQPWFAQVTGGIGLTLNEIDSNGDSSSGEIVTGNGELFVLPQSRFPFNLHYDRTDSRVSGELVGTPYTNTRWGLTQRYRNLANNFSMSFAYDNTLQETEGSDEDTSDFLNLSMMRRYADHNINFNSSRQETERNSDNRQYNQDTMYVRHTYRPDPNLTVESNASIIETDDTIDTTFNETQYLQLNSYTIWRPKSKPMTVTGGARFFGTTNTTDSTTTETNSIHAHGGINYSFSRHVRLTGNATLTSTETDGAETLSTTQTAGVSYNPETIELKGYRYNWSASASAGNRTGLDDEGQHVSGSLGHNLLRNFKMGSGALLTASVGQSVVAEFDTAADTSHRLVHNGSLAWRRSQNGHNTSLRLTASDSRSFGGDVDEEFQLVNFQASNDRRLSTYASWTGHLTIQAIRQITESSQDSGFSFSSGGSLVYRHNKAFGKPRLRFTSSLQLNNSEEVAPLPFLSSEGQRSSWENRFDYSIGRLDLSLSMRISEVNGNMRELLLFQVKRRFGN